MLIRLFDMQIICQNTYELFAYDLVSYYTKFGLDMIFLDKTVHNQSLKSHFK